MPLQKGEPQPGDLILHECGGKARHWMGSGAREHCKKCSAPLAADLPYRPGHAHLICSVCRTVIGVCAGEALEEVADGAHHVIRMADRKRRKDDPRG